MLFLNTENTLITSEKIEGKSREDSMNNQINEGKLYLGIYWYD